VVTVKRIAALKVPRSWQILFLAKLHFKEGKVLRSEIGEVFGSGLRCKQTNSGGFNDYDRNFDIVLGWNFDFKFGGLTWCETLIVTLDGVAREAFTVRRWNCLPNQRLAKGNHGKTWQIWFVSKTFKVQTDFWSSVSHLEARNLTLVSIGVF
jgi:hypothetical protein